MLGSTVLTKIRNIVRNTKLSPHGGIVFVMDEIRSNGLHRLFDEHLGKRVKQAKYSHSDILLSWIHSTFCGSERLEDTKHLKTFFDEIPDIKQPSPDRIAGIFKSFATETEVSQTENAIHEFNINEPLNRLLIDTSLKLKLINPNADYTLDYDNLIIENEKHDSKKTYKMKEGYQPGVAFVNYNIPVYVENRNGNSIASYQMTETIERAFELLDEKCIKIKRFRSDSAAYSQSLTRMLADRGVEFFIRARNSPKLYSEIIDNGDWVKVEIGGELCEIASTTYNFGGREFRIVVTKDLEARRKNKSRSTGDHFGYRAIITNNLDLSNVEVVRFYNARGKMELAFRDLLNDWNWRRIPFSYLNQNTVFMIFGAIGYNIYHHIIRKYSKLLPFVKSTFRLKNFIFHFISVTMEWIQEGEEKVPILYSPERDYSPLWKRPPS